jgi:dephospho-CoA kinase
MQVIGLTGGIASGKSTVGRLLEMHQAVVIDADALAHDCMRPGGSAYAGVVDYFGPNVLDADGAIDRQELGALVFSDPTQLARLNQLVHPQVRLAMKLRLEALEKAGNTHPVFLMVPLLYESNLVHWVDEVWVVYCRPEQQLERLVLRNHFSVLEATERLNAQWPIDKKRERADVVIDNTGTADALEKQITQALQRRLS